METVSLIASVKSSLGELRHNLARLPQHQVQQQLEHAEERLATVAEGVAELEITLSLLRLIVTAGDTDNMVCGVAQFLKQWSEVEAVGVRLREGEDFPYFTTLGFPDEFVRAENRLGAVDHYGHKVRDADGKLVLECMCGKVINGQGDDRQSFFSSGGSFWTNNTSELLRVTPPEALQTKTRNRCNAHGYESVALVPLRAGEETFGLLQLNDTRTDRFDPGKIRILEELARYVAAALD